MRTMIAVLAPLLASPIQLPSATAVPQSTQDAVAVSVVRCCDSRARISSLPYAITAPGSYVVVKHLVAAGAGDGITVSTQGVTIDLNGYTLDGNGVGSTGILATPGSKNVSVTNGTIRRWAASGIDAAGVEGGRFVDLHLDSNAALSGAAGLVLGTTCIAERCTLVSNGNVSNDAFGIHVMGGNSLVLDCTVGHTNGDGIVAEARCTVRGCTVLRSSGVGIRAGGFSTVLENDLIENAGHGIEVLAVGGGHSRIEGNHVTTFSGASNIFVESSIPKIVIVRNFATGGTPEYDVPMVPGVGPIGPAMGATNPWANMVY